MNKFEFCSFESRECIVSSTSKTVTFFAILLWKFPQKEQQTYKLWSIQFHKNRKQFPYISTHFIYSVNWPSCWAKMVKISAWNSHWISIQVKWHRSWGCSKSTPCQYATKKKKRFLTDSPQSSRWVPMQCFPEFRNCISNWKKSFRTRRFFLSKF